MLRLGEPETHGNGGKRKEGGRKGGNDAAP